MHLAIQALSLPTTMTKVLTHLNKTNAFYRRPSVISKKSFLSIVKPHCPPVSMLKYPNWTPSRGYNVEKGREGWRCGYWRFKNSLVQRNRSFSESVSTAFVNDSRLQKQRKPNINANISMLLS